MPRGWFYSHNGRSHGPVTARQIKALAATGGLMPDDVVWPEGVEPSRGVEAAKALDFAALRRAAQEARRRGENFAPPAPPVAKEAPAADDNLLGWRDELSQLFRDPEEAVGPVPDWLEQEKPAASALPDWLAEMRPLAAPAPKPLPPPASRVTPPPAPAASPPASGPGAGPFYVKREPPRPPAAVPEAPPVGAPVLDRMGIDPATGRVVDRVKFDAWQEEQRLLQSEELPAPRDYDADPFRTARKQLAAWMDLDKNRDRLARGDFNALRHDAALQRFLLHFEKYGSEKCKNLRDYTEFLIEARTAARRSTRG